MSMGLAVAGSWRATLPFWWRVARPFSLTASAIPVLVYQGTITLMAKSAEQYLHNQALLDSVNATGGLVIFCISLVILEIRRVEVANYLPSLIFAPLLTYWWR